MKYKGNGRGVATNQAKEETKRPRRTYESSETEFWLTPEYEDRFEKELKNCHDKWHAHKATQEAMKNGWR